MSPQSSAPRPGEAAAEGVYRELIEDLEVGIALVEPETWRIRFENARFTTWFAPAPETGGEVPLDGRIGDFDTAAAREKLERGRPYELERECGNGARTRRIVVEVRPVELGGEPLAIVECHDDTKRQQAEHMLDSYSRLADNNVRDLKRETERAEKLLLNVMPRAVYEEMRDYGSVAPQRFDQATIVMLDFVGFTEMAISHDPGSLVSELNDIFSAFDRIVELFHCERMKTIGDAYMAGAGIPEPSSDHVRNAARVALRMRRYLERRNSSNREPWLARIGLHTGPVVGSIVGVQRYVYDVFGPGVNLAVRMEALSEPMQITISSDVFDRIGDEFICSERGEFDVKGFGRQTLYSLDGEVDHRH